jgi:hypothetical protein
MRINFAGVGRPKKVAKYLKGALAARGREIGLRKCEEIIAKMTGYTNWHELQITTALTTVYYARDTAVGEAEAAARREQYVSHLSEHAQVSRELAGDVVDEIKPTGVRVNRACKNPPQPFPHHSQIMTLSDCSKPWQRQNG